MLVPWLDTTAGSPWSTQRTEVPAVECTLALPDGWAQTETPATDGAEVASMWRGDSPVEWITVRRLSVDDDSVRGELVTWVRATLATIGFPVIPPGDLLVEMPKLVDFRAALREACDGARERFGVDEVCLFDGTARWGSGPGGRFLHLYVVLARRGELAWNVALAFDSAAVPGVPDDIVARSDHTRAAAVLADLQFGPTA